MVGKLDVLFSDKFIPVSSTNIASIKEESKLKLEVQASEYQSQEDVLFDWNVVSFQDDKM